MVSLNWLLGKMESPTYKCTDLARDAWMSICGEDIAVRFPSLFGPVSARKVTASGVRLMRAISKPESPCIVVMRPGKGVGHVGVYYDGNVFHLSGYGACFQSLAVASRQYPIVRFYR